MVACIVSSVVIAILLQHSSRSLAATLFLLFIYYRMIKNVSILLYITQIVSLMSINVRNSTMNQDCVSRWNYSSFSSYLWRQHPPTAVETDSQTAGTLHAADHGIRYYSWHNHPSEVTLNQKRCRLKLNETCEIEVESSEPRSVIQNIVTEATIYSVEGGVWTIVAACSSCRTQ